MIYKNKSALRTQNSKFKKPVKTKSGLSSKAVDSVARDQIWLFGTHPVKMALLNPTRKIFRILVTANNKKELEDFLKENNLVLDKKLIAIVTHEEIEAKFSTKVIHQGIALLCSNLNPISDNDFLAQVKNEKKCGNIIILDQLTDQHNIGAIIRSAVAFGVKNVGLIKQNFGGETATICKSSSGAIEKANLILIGNLNDFILRLKKSDYWVIGLDGYGKNEFSEMKNFQNICLIIGSEGEGIRHLVKKNCDLLVKIPINEVESLNASNAAAIALYQISLK